MLNTCTADTKLQLQTLFTLVPNAPVTNFKAANPYASSAKIPANNAAASAFP